MSFATDGNEICVRVIRDALNSPWGFRLHGGSEYNSPLVVAKVFKGTASDGNLQVGDIIKRIGRTDAVRLSHRDATQAISSAGSSLDFLVVRGSAAGGFRPNAPQKRTPISRWRQVDQSEIVIPQNKTLAQLMQKSLQPGEDGQPVAAARKHRTRHTVDLPLLRGHRAEADVGTFLPSRYSYPRGGTLPRDHRASFDVRDGVTARSSSQGSSGRSSPSTSIIELRSPGDHNPAVGVWSPPTHNPGAKLTHLQYNSPMPMYAANNIADAVEKMSGGKIDWINKRPGATYLEDIRDSPTYKLVQEAEGKRPLRQPPNFQQSKTIRNLESMYHTQGVFKE